MPHRLSCTVSMSSFDSSYTTFMTAYTALAYAVPVGGAAAAVVVGRFTAPAHKIWARNARPKLVRSQ